MPTFLQAPKTSLTESTHQLNKPTGFRLELWLLICASLAIFWFAFIGPVYPAPKDELKQLRSRIEGLQKELADAEESKSDAADALRESERAISEANRKLYELNRQQREVNASLASLQSQSGQTESGMRAQQALLEKLLYQLYLGNSWTIWRCC